jgi:predicted ATPase
MNELPLQSFRLKNFKAVQDSGSIKFSPLTVFIGNNGSGKSSIIEGLETLHVAITQSLDRAMRSWSGFEYIWNQAVAHDKLIKKSGLRPYYENPMSFELKSRLEGKTDVNYMLEIATGEGQDENNPFENDLFIKQEKLSQKGRNVPTFNFTRDDSNHVIGSYTVDNEEKFSAALVGGISLLNISTARLPYDLPVRNFIHNWQFLEMIPRNMGHPVSRVGGQVRLEKDGSNIAEYLLNIQRINSSIFEDIVRTLQYVLPYSQDLQIALTSELERTVYLQLLEGKFKVPGWLLSTGTLRIVALLALLRHPEPPPLIVIEEIENGLDPRSVHLIIEEMRSAIEDGKTQIIMTTHSPYLLNLLRLEEIVLVERVEGQSVFTRPGNDQSLQQWAEDYGPGDLYVMSKLNKKG